MQKIIQAILSILSSLKNGRGDFQNTPVSLVNQKAEPVVTISKEVIPSSGFLVCPIKEYDIYGQPLTSRTVKISAVIDHSGTAIDPNSTNGWGKGAKDQKVKAFNGETGMGNQCPQEPCGYPKIDSGDFFPNKEINYVGVLSDGGKQNLQYDGHAGYDFPYQSGTGVLAPSDGELFKATQGTDSIYNAHWDKDHSFYIKHKNGFITWFRHCSKLVDNLEASIGNDFNKSCHVESGQLIAESGNFENGKIGGTAAHLHFEVLRNKMIVDPYSDKLWVA
ncbi:MAG: M23 family metallopeptidase [Patescibacteria group bacterium]